MKIKKVNRYYCDFCKRSGGHAGWMRKHEKGCTNNPNRICGLCKIIDEIQPSLKQLINIIQGGLNPSMEIHDETIKKLRYESNNCPACMLAAMRQCNKDTWFEFNFRQELESFWKTYNENLEPHDQSGYWVY